MIADDDWRLLNASRLRGALFRWKRWYQWSPTWDHDHCVGCWAKFSLHEGGEILKEGYAIAGGFSIHDEDYYWLCRSCFDDLKETLGWSEA